MEIISIPPGNSTVTSELTDPWIICFTFPFRTFRALILIFYPPSYLL